MEEERRPWCHLPNDILISISARLFRDERIRFMAVCKGWSSITPLPSSNTDESESPCLLIKGPSNKYWLYTPLFRKSYRMKIPELVFPEYPGSVQIRCSKNRWILLSKSNQYYPSHLPLFLFNLYTRSTINLPVLNLYEGCPSYCVFTFSSIPTRSDFQVLVISNYNTKFVSIGTYHSGDEKWSVKIHLNNDVFCRVKTTPVLFQGMFYCLDILGKLGVYDHLQQKWTITKAKPRQFVLPSYKGSFDDMYHDRKYENFLVESGGDLIAIFMAYEVHVFRLDRFKMVWEVVTSLGDRELFSGLSRSISVKGCPNMDCMIYVPGYKQNDSAWEFLHPEQTECWGDFYQAFNLNTKKYIPRLTASWKWKESSNYTWIELEYWEWKTVVEQFSENTWNLFRG